MKRLGIGCGLILLLAGLGIGTLLAIGWNAARSEKLVEPSVEHAVSEAAAALDGQPSTSDSVVSASAGIIRLSMRAGQIYVEPADVGEPLQVQARYDPEYYRLEESMGEGTPWTYRVELQRSGSSLVAGLKEMFGGNQPHVRVRVPRGVPLRIELVVSGAGADLDIGGLFLTSAKLEFDGGYVDLEAKEPLPFPVEKIEIKGARGVFLVDSIAHANPRVLEIDFSMGEAQLDLRGTWVADSAIALTTKMADVVVRLPRGRRIEGLETERLLEPPPTELGGATLSFDVTTGVRGAVKVFE